MDRLLPVVTALFQDLSARTWPAILEDAAPLFDARIVHFWVTDPKSGETVLDVMNESQDRAIADEYKAHFAAQDPRLPLLTRLDGRTQPCWKTIDPVEFDRSDVVRGYLDRPDIDMRWSLATGAILDKGFELITGAARSRSMGAFSLAEARQFDFLAQNLRNAVNLKIRLDAMQAARLTQEASDDPSLKSSLVIDPHGKLLFASTAADRALASGQIFSVEHGRLKAMSAMSERRLERYLSRHMESPGFFASDSWFEGDPAYRVCLSVLPGSEADDLTAMKRDRSAILVTVEGPLGGRTASAMLAERGLSLAEREVALSIIAGQSVREIAEEKQRSVETIRSQLKSLMAKLGLSRQAELVRFVAGSRG